jgi:hypothetical protein
MAKINTQRMEWGIMIAAINAAATNSAIATLVLSLVGLWVITQLRIWRYVPRTSPCAREAACLEGPNLSLAITISPRQPST